MIRRLLVRLAFSALILASVWRVSHQLIAVQSLRTLSGWEGVQKAVSWDPSNPDFYFQRGLFFQDDLDNRDLEAAGTDLRRAVELNPHNWRYWLALARYYEISGDNERAREAYLKTVALSPQSGLYHWRLANFFLRSDEIDSSLQHMKLALSLDPAFLDAGADLLLKLGVSAETFEEVWPQNREALMKLTRFLVSRAKRVETTWGHSFIDRQWDSISALTPGPDPKEAGFYLEYLIDSGRYERAQMSWARLLQNNNLPFDAEENLVWNGDFERRPDTPVLGWVIDQTDGFESRRERGSGVNYTVGLKLDFDGRMNLNFQHIRHRIIVQPGERYEFSFQARSEKLSTDQGLFFQITSQKGLLTETEKITGTSPWKRYSAIVDVPRDVELITLVLRRRPSRRIDSLIGGTFWLDDVVLQHLRLSQHRTQK